MILIDESDRLREINIKKSRSIWEQVPIVEERLPLLIQKLLEAQIKKHPPLFPWETKIDEDDKNEPEVGKPINDISVSSPPPLTSSE
jgi:hypothetical protein